MNSLHGNGNGAVPFVDLVTLHRELEEELTSVFRSAIHDASFIGGAMVEDFERAFAGFCGTRHCVGVNSGTDALRFALIASGVRPGDAVVTVPNTFIATAEAISQAGAMPLFVDVDARTYNMDPGKLQEFLETACERDERTGRTLTRRGRHPVAAIVPVHLYGQPCDMDALMGVAARYGLLVIEDACQAHGAEYFSAPRKAWVRAGSMGRAAAFSFYPGKNLGACGDAGAVTTDDDGIAAKIRMLRDHGQTRKYHHACEGYNGRLDAIQAGLLHVKLAHLPGWNAARADAAASYHRLLGAAGAAIVVPFHPGCVRAAHHLYVVQVEDRDKAQADLAAAGIGTGIHYPIPLHLQPAYARLGHVRGDFPVAEAAADRILSLPMFPGITSAQQERVVEALAASLAFEAASTAAALAQS